MAIKTRWLILFSDTIVCLFPFGDIRFLLCPCAVFTLCGRKTLEWNKCMHFVWCYNRLIKRSTWIQVSPREAFWSDNFSFPFTWRSHKESHPQLIHCGITGSERPRHSLHHPTSLSQAFLTSSYMYADPLMCVHNRANQQRLRGIKIQAALQVAGKTLCCKWSPQLIFCNIPNSKMCSVLSWTCNSSIPGP